MNSSVPQESPISTVKGNRFLPVWESKLLHQYDPYFSTYHQITETAVKKGQPRTLSIEEKAAGNSAMPRYWVSDVSVDQILEVRGWSKRWIACYRDITNATNERTAIAAILGECGACQPLNLFLPETPSHAAIWVGSLDSYVIDYVVRQTIGGVHLNITTCRQLPLLAPGDISQFYLSWIIARTIELQCTSTWLNDFARDCDYDGPPFIWNDNRRFQIRCELDAMFFHLYLGTESEWRDSVSQELLEYFPSPRTAVEYIMEKFPIVKRKDEAKFDGKYRTKELILEIYDKMAEAIATGTEYKTILNPPPGPPCDAHGNFIPYADWTPEIHQQYRGIIHPPHQDVEVPGKVAAEVDFASLTELSYPSTETDQMVCAASVAAIDQAGELSSMEHLDAVLLATHPDWCKAFLSDTDKAKLDTAITSVPSALIIEGDNSIRWKEARDYLEQRKALTVNHSDSVQPIASGTDLASVKASLPSGTDDIVVLALKAVEQVHILRTETAQANKEQQQILTIFQQQAESAGLAVA